MTVTPDRFGRDHWSTFAYIETRAVDYQGRLDPRHMRAGSHHPLLRHVPIGLAPKDYPTRLAGGTQLVGHDDWDCLTDFEAAGYLTRSLKGGIILTDKGRAVAAALRAHKQLGKAFVDFTLPETLR